MRVRCPIAVIQEEDKPPRATIGCLEGEDTVEWAPGVSWRLVDIEDDHVIVDLGSAVSLPDGVEVA